MVAATTTKHLFEVEGFNEDGEAVSVFALENNMHAALDAVEYSLSGLKITCCHQIDDHCRHVLWLFKQEDFHEDDEGDG